MNRTPLQGEPTGRNAEWLLSGHKQEGTAIGSPALSKLLKTEEALQVKGQLENQPAKGTAPSRATANNSSHSCLTCSNSALSLSGLALALLQVTSKAKAVR